MSEPGTIYWGLKLYEWLTLFGIVIGPISAVLISLWIDGRRRARDQKLTILRMLISTRHLPADPAFFTAVNLVPIEFSKSRKVIIAYKEFIIASSSKADSENANDVVQNTYIKTVRLVYEVARDLGFALRETDLQTESYVSQGFGTRDGILLDSQKAMRDVAIQLSIQTRLLAGGTMSADEKRYLGLPDA